MTHVAFVSEHSCFCKIFISSWSTWNEYLLVYTKPSISHLPVLPFPLSLSAWLENPIRLCVLVGSGGGAGRMRNMSGEERKTLVIGKKLKLVGIDYRWDYKDFWKKHFWFFYRVCIGFYRKLVFCWLKMSIFFREYVIFFAESIYFFTENVQFYRVYDFYRERKFLKRM